RHPAEDEQVGEPLALDHLDDRPAPQADRLDLVDDLLDVPHVVDEEDRPRDPLLATGRVAEGQVDRRPPGQDEVRVGGDQAPASPVTSRKIPTPRKSSAPAPGAPSADSCPIAFRRAAISSPVRLRRSSAPGICQASWRRAICSSRPPPPLDRPASETLKLGPS